MKANNIKKSKLENHKLSSMKTIAASKAKLMATSAYMNLTILSRVYLIEVSSLKTLS